MSTSPHSSTEHLTEGELVRYLDGEVDARERSGIAAHLLACIECRGGLEELRTAREELAALLGPLASTPDPSRKEVARAALERALAESARRATPRLRGAWLRAAMVAPVLLASGLAISPARAWFVRLWNETVTPAEHRADAAAPATAPVALSLSNATIGFVPRSDSFLLEVRSHQQGGALVLGIAEGASITASASGEEEIALLVRPDGMRIENDPHTTADYAIRLPAHLREVRIRIGEGAERSYPVDQLARSWISVIPLEAEPGTGPGAVRASE